MSWGFALAFWLLPVVVALAMGRWQWHRRLLQVRRTIGAGIPELSTGVSRPLVRLRQTLLWSGLCIATIAIASPRWGTADTTQKAKGCDVLVVLDCSRSMYATDIYPNRLEVARHKALDFLRIAPETRMALLPFAGVATLRCPLTGDKDAIAEMLKDCSPELFPAPDYQGTAIGEAVKQGLTVLNKQVDRGQAVLVLSDGADDDKAAVTAAAQAAKDAGVPVYGVFLGDTERKIEMDIDGHKEVMDASDATLKELADKTGALCLQAGLDDSDVRTIHDHLIAHVQQGEWEERRRVVASERFQWVVIPAILLLALGLFVPTRRRRG